MEDGEVVAFEGRRTSFERLQGRIAITDPAAARATGIRVHYYVYDVLHLAGHDTRSLPLRARKKLLRTALAFDDPLRFTVHRVGAGEEAYRQACERGDEGVIAKRADAAYTGGRSTDWLKFKCVRDQESSSRRSASPSGRATACSGIRAIRACAPIRTRATSSASNAEPEVQVASRGTVSRGMPLSPRL